MRTRSRFNHYNIVRGFEVIFINKINEEHTNISLIGSIKSSNHSSNHRTKVKLRDGSGGAETSKLYIWPRKNYFTQIESN